MLKMHSMKASVKLNQELICTLNSVLGISPELIWTSANITRGTWYNIMRKPGDISIEQLLGISNGQKIPVRRFFYTTHEHVVGKKDDYIVEPYMECSYNASVLHEIINTHSDATWQKAAKVVDLSPSRLRNSLLAITRTPVSRFLIVCETFGIDPFTILIDPNPEYRNTGKRSKSAFLAEINALRQQVASLNANTSDLNSKYADLAGKYDGLQTKYDNLLEAHKMLLQRFNDHIEERSIGMAAEPIG